MGIFDNFPYTNFHELNLDWMLQALKEIEVTMNQFVTINSLKYADPIQWNITKQYEKNTIVIDPLTGTAYISVQAVPNGVTITNTDYWTVVFDLSQFIVRAAQNFTSRYETATTLTATFPTPAGGWLVWKDVLYKALVNITAGDSYVVGSNIEHFTIEDLHNAYLTTVANILGTIGDLDDLTTTDKTSVVNAINEVNLTGGGALAKIGNLDELTTTDKSDLVHAINEVDANADSILDRIDKAKIFNVLDYGADPSLANNSAAFNAAIEAAYDAKGVVYIPNGTYKFTSSIMCKDKVSMIGESMYDTLLMAMNSMTLVNIINVDLRGILFKNFTLWNNATLKTGYGFAGGSTLENYNSAIATFENIRIYGFYNGINGLQESRGVGIFDSLFINLYIDHCFSGINVSGSGNVYIHCRLANNNNGFYFSHMNNESFDGGTVIGGVCILNNYDMTIDGINRPISFLGTWFEQCTYGIINCPTPTAGYGFIFRSCMFNTLSTVYDLVNMNNYSGMTSVEQCTIIQTIVDGMTNVLGIDTYDYVVEYKDGTSQKFTNKALTSDLTPLDSRLDTIEAALPAIQTAIDDLPIYATLDCPFNNSDTCTVTHSLGRRPTNILLTPVTDLQGHSYRVANRTETTFDIVLDDVVTLSAFFFAQIK